VKSPYKVWTGELRLTSNNDEGFGWGVGAFYTKQTGTTVVEQPADSFFFPVSVKTSPDIIGGLPYLPIHTSVTVPIHRTTWSFNANLRYKSGPLKVEGGIRYSIIKSIQTTQLGLALGPNSLAGPDYVSQVIVPPYEIISPDLQRIVDKPITGGLNVTYEISPTLNVYAAYGHSFRAGTNGVITQLVSSDLLQSKAEKTDSYEVGFKGSLANRRIDFSVAAFYQNLKGFMSRFNNLYWESALDPSGSGFLSANYNGDAKIKGVEAEINGRVTRDWDIGINASYAHARYSGARLPCNDFDGSGIPNQNGAPTVQGSGNVSYCTSNSRLAEMPDFNLSATTEARFPMGNVVPFVRGIVSYRPGFYSDRADFKYPSRTLLNLYAGIRSEDSGWEVNVFVKNVLNQKRITNIALGNFVQSTSAGVAYDSGYRLVNTMNPREAGITASYKF